MKKIILPVFALALIALTGTAGTAMANQYPHDEVRHHRTDGAHPGPGGFFAHFDANHDGKITRAEFDKASDRMFTRLDKNHDGVVTRDEIRANMKNHMKTMHEMHGKRDPHKGRHAWRGKDHRGPHRGNMTGWHDRGGEGWNHRLDYSHANDDNGQ
jgi:hypothetical protein